MRWSGKAAARLRLHRGLFQARSIDHRATRILRVFALRGRRTIDERCPRGRKSPVLGLGRECVSKGTEFRKPNRAPPRNTRYPVVRACVPAASRQHREPEYLCPDVVLAPEESTNRRRRFPRRDRNDAFYCRTLRKCTHAGVLVADACEVRRPRFRRPGAPARPERLDNSPCAGTPLTEFSLICPYPPQFRESPDSTLAQVSPPGQQTANFPQTHV